MRNFLAGLSGGSGAFAAAGVCLVLIVAGFYIQSGRDLAEVEETLAALPAQTPQADAPASSELPAPASAPEVSGPSQPEEDLAAGSDTETAPAPEADVPPISAPAFDEVRRDPDGVTVIAGRAEPGAEVIVLQNGDEVAATTADTSGKFATIAMIPLDGEGHVLRLVQRFRGERQTSDDEIILAPLTAPVEVAEASPEDAPEPVNTPLAEAEAVDTPQDAAPAADETLVAHVEPAPEPENAPLAAAETVDTPQDTAPAADETQVARIEPAPEPDEGGGGTTSAPTVAQQDGDTTDEPAPASVQETQVATADTSPASAPEEMAKPEAPAVREDSSQTQQLAATSPEAQTAAPLPLTPQTPSAEVEQPRASTATTPPSRPASVEAPSAPPAQPARVAVLRSTAEGVELLNAPNPEVMDNVAIDTISYSEVGVVQLAGRAQSEATAVRVYLNNNAIVSMPVGADGRWRGDLPDVDEGIYTLRVDEVAADGKVTSRVETPFKREAPATLVAAAAQQEGPIKAITVQRGATLWAIARERYGDGKLYVRVFEANRSAIRDPDLIYPGQIFDLPD